MKQNQRPGTAVMKSILKQLPKDEFIAYAALFTDQIHEAKSGSKRYHYYRVMYAWCKEHYKQNFSNRYTR